VRSVVVAVDVGGDHLPCLLEGLELVQPDAAFLQLREPRFDERLRLRVAVAAAAGAIPSPEMMSLNALAVKAEPL
jgi:hypothetical protein